MSVRLAQVKNLKIDVNFCILNSMLAQIEVFDVIDGFEYVGYGDGQCFLLVVINDDQIIIRPSDEHDVSVASDKATAVKNKSLRELARVLEKVEQSELEGPGIFEGGGAFRFDGVFEDDSIVFEVEGEEFVAVVDC